MISTRQCGMLSRSDLRSSWNLKNSYSCATIQSSLGLSVYSTGNFVLPYTTCSLKKVMIYTCNDQQLVWLTLMLSWSSCTKHSFIFNDPDFVIPNSASSLNLILLEPCGTSTWDVAHLKFKHYSIMKKNKFKNFQVHGVNWWDCVLN